MKKKKGGKRQRKRDFKNELSLQRRKFRSLLFSLGLAFEVASFFKEKEIHLVC